MVLEMEALLKLMESIAVVMLASYHASEYCAIDRSSVRESAAEEKVKTRREKRKRKNLRSRPLPPSLRLRPPLPHAADGARGR